jgi:hypothetical protein
VAEKTQRAERKPIAENRKARHDFHVLSTPRQASRSGHGGGRREGRATRATATRGSRTAERPLNVHISPTATGGRRHMPRCGSKLPLHRHENESSWADRGERADAGAA